MVTVNGMEVPLAELAANLTNEQLEEARAHFNLFDKDGRGEIGTKELGYSLARLGQTTTEQELDGMVAEFDTDGDGTINFQEFLVMMNTLGWGGVSQGEGAECNISFYAQASLTRWLDDDDDEQARGDIFGPNVPGFTMKCRVLVADKNFEYLIYLCIVVAAVISGMQSYKVDSEYDNATWAVVIDYIILVVFTTEVGVKVFAENKSYPHHFFADAWNLFDLIICSALLISAAMHAASTVAPFRLVRLLRAIRLLRTVRLFPNLAIIIETTVRSCSSVIYIGFFGSLVTYMYAIVGVATFGKNDPFYFGNLARAMMTLFRVISMDSWSAIMYYEIWGCGQPNYDGLGNSRGFGDYFAETGMECEYQPAGGLAAMYFVTFMCLAAFLILNLLIGLVTTEMQDAKREAMEARKVSNKLELASRLRKFKSKAGSASVNAAKKAKETAAAKAGGKRANFNNPQYDDDNDDDNGKSGDEIDLENPMAADLAGKEPVATFGDDDVEISGRAAKNKPPKPKKGKPKEPKEVEFGISELTVE